jgi:hypothetical protein
VLLSASAALLLFAAGPVPRSAAAPGEPQGASLVHSSRPAARLSAPRPLAPADGPRLRAERELVGEVHALDGPVPGLRITALSAGEPSGAASERARFADRQGRFRLPDPGPRARRLVALGADGAAIEGPLVPSSREERAALLWQLDWRLVRLRVLDAEGAPLAGCALRAIASIGAECFAVRHRTDAEGRCAVLVRGGSEVELELAPAVGRGAPQRARFGAGSAEQVWRIGAR